MDSYGIKIENVFECKKDFQGNMIKKNVKIPECLQKSIFQPALTMNSG